MTAPSVSTRTGTPTSTTSPSTTELERRITATTTYETIAPAPRAVMSKAPPARRASFETVATTSPVETRARTAGPHRATWCETTWMSRNEARSQFCTARRWRITPANPTMIPSPSRRSAHRARAAASSSTTPSWIPRPIVYGIRAWATIQRIPNTMPRASEPSCCFATQTSSRAGVRAPGVPGSATGSGCIRMR